MASAFTKVGLMLFILGLLILFIVPISGTKLPFMAEIPKQSKVGVTVPKNGSYVDLLLAKDISHPFFVQIDLKLSLHSVNGGVYAGNLGLIYSNPDKKLFGTIPRTNTDYYADSAEDIQITLRVMIAPKYTSNKFDIILRITGYNWYEDTCYLEDRQLIITYILWAGVIPLVSALLGLFIVIGGFIYNYRRLSKRPTLPKADSPTWEPSLQTRVSPLADKKAVTKTEGQQACRFCGKDISPSEVYCPHCYTKLR